jgi:SAM-dependent methyltransferase
MRPSYEQDLAYIQAVGFGSFARSMAPEIIQILNRASIQIRRIVDVGCGAGPLTEALVEAGFAVTAIDTSTELLEIARRAVPAARFINTSVYDVPLPPCEAIVALGESLTYHAEHVDADHLVSRFFDAAAAVLPAGGMLIFDVIEPGEPSLCGRFWSCGDDWAVLSETSENPAQRNLVRDIQAFRRVGEFYRRTHEVHTVRVFDPHVLTEQLASRGFKTETAQSYGARPLPPRRRAFLATRIVHP